MDTMKQDLSEDVLWKEREELEKTEKPDDSFIPAKECKMDKESAKIYIEL